MSNVIIGLVKVSKGQGWNKIPRALEAEFGVDCEVRIDEKEEFKVCRVEMSGHGWNMFMRLIKQNTKGKERVPYQWYQPEEQESSSTYALLSSMYYDMPVISNGVIGREIDPKDLLG